MSTFMAHLMPQPSLFNSSCTISPESECNTVTGVQTCLLQCHHPACYPLCYKESSFHRNTHSLSWKTLIMSYGLQREGLIKVVLCKSLQIQKIFFSSCQWSWEYPNSISCKWVRPPTTKKYHSQIPLTQNGSTRQVWWIDFYGMSTCLELFHASRLVNCIHSYLHFLCRFLRDFCSYDIMYS